MATAKRQGGTIDRRRFVIQAAAVGLATVPIGTALRTAAHQATPMGGQEMAIVTEHYALADGDAEAIWFLGTLALIKGVGSRTGGMLATVLHVHHLADESFYVLAGGMRGICGDQEWAATTGAFVWLPRGIPHGYAVDGDETLKTLAITVPAGFDRFVVEAGEPAQERILPPPTPPDLAKLEAAGAKYGIETLGPPVEFTSTPTA
ncbi:MAG: cupin domain-containing protein [Thermomicrobiales bacterium]